MARPQTTAVLAMTADGKIASGDHGPPEFGSEADRAHLEDRIAEADAVLFGAATLRAHGTTVLVPQAKLHQGRQPPQIVGTRSARLDPQLPFFRQPVPRWLLSTRAGAAAWQQRPECFERTFTAERADGAIDWPSALAELAQAGVVRLAAIGGGELVASLLAVGAIDDIWLTVCPVVLGGRSAPTPVEGEGFPLAQAPRLSLLSARPVGEEIFLHYRVREA
jgi:5-amino-6-(5-phosphoribosylamino)uracil reductase